MDICEWNRKYSEISNRYNALYRKAAAHFGFSDYQFRILYKLYIESFSTTQNKLADEFCVSKQTVNSAVQKLAEEGLIKLVKGNEAKNSKLISLTDKGKKSCQNTIKRLIAAENSAIGKIDDEKLRWFLELFEMQYMVFEKEVGILFEEENKCVNKEKN